MASPPCQAYSRVRTTPPATKTDLKEADKLVAIVQKFATELDSIACIVENPATGLLVGRDVITFLEHTTTVNYCKYGGLLRKATMLWSSFPLTSFGFTPLLCTNDNPCVGASIMKGHFDWVLTPTPYRQAIPHLLSVCVGGCIREFVRATYYKD